MSNPLIIQTKSIDSGEIKQLAAHDVLEIKIAIYVALTGVMAKIIYDWWTRDTHDKSSDIKVLLAAHHKNEERLENIEKLLERLSDDMIQRHELTDFVRKEIDWFHRVKIK